MPAFRRAAGDGSEPGATNFWVGKPLSLLLIASREYRADGLRTRLEQHAAVGAIRQAGETEEGIEAATQLQPDAILVSREPGLGIDRGYLARLHLAHPDARTLLIADAGDGEHDLIGAPGVSGYLCWDTLDLEALVGMLPHICRCDLWVGEVEVVRRASLLAGRGHGEAEVRTIEVDEQEHAVAAALYAGLHGKEAYRATNMSSSTFDRAATRLSKKVGAQGRFELGDKLAHCVLRVRRGGQ